MRWGFLLLFLKINHSEIIFQKQAQKLRYIYVLIYTTIIEKQHNEILG